MEHRSITSLAAETLAWLERRIVRREAGHVLPDVHNDAFRKQANAILGAHLLGSQEEYLSEQERDGLEAFFHALKWNNTDLQGWLLLAQTEGVALGPFLGVPMELAYRPEMVEAVLVALRLITERDESQSIAELSSQGPVVHPDQSTEPVETLNRPDRESEQHVSSAASGLNALESEKPKPFIGGEMVFHDDRVELCGVDICSGRRREQARKVLDLLRQKHSDGKFVPYSGDELAESIGSGGGQNTAAGLIRDLRTRISDQLRDEANIKCGRDEVILSGGPGYRLNDSISVHDGDESLNSQLQGHGVPIAEHDVPDGPNPDDPNVPDGPNPHDPNVPDGDVAARRNWILQELGKERKLQAPDIAKELDCSPRTIKRDLRVLTDEGRIEFTGASRTGHYRLKKGTIPR